MKARTCFPVSGLHGSLKQPGGNYFRVSRGQTILQRGSVSNEVPTVPQITQQKIVRLSIVAWNALSSTVKGQWDTWVRENQSIAIGLNGRVFSTGYEAFVSRSVMRRLGGLTANPAIPTGDLPPRVSSISLWVRITGLDDLRGPKPLGVPDNFRLVTWAAGPFSQVWRSPVESQFAKFAPVTGTRGFPQLGAGPTWRQLSDCAATRFPVGSYAYFRIWLVSTGNQLSRPVTIQYQKS
jgi:hypothetical protein